MNLPAIVRTFIAIDVPSELKQVISRIQKDLATTREERIGWVKPEGVHLTLQFLGDVEREKVPELVTAIKNAVAGRKDFTLRTTAQGAFPRLSQPKTYWIGVDGGIDLMDVHKNLVLELNRLGIANDGGKFHPHLTVGRVKDLPRESIITSRFAAMEIQEFSWNAGSLNLMSSRLLPTGAEYSVLDSVDFIK